MLLATFEYKIFYADCVQAAAALHREMGQAQLFDNFSFKKSVSWRSVPKKLIHACSRVQSHQKMPLARSFAAGKHASIAQFAQLLCLQ